VSSSGSEAGVLEGSDAVSERGAAASALRVPRTLDERLTMLAVRMLIVACSFGWIAWFFAQIFLQITNSNNLWLPTTLKRPLGMGVIEAVLIVASWLAYLFGHYGGLYRRKNETLTLSLFLAAVLSVVAIITHVLVLHSPGFLLQDGGYASVFVGMEGVYTTFLIFSTIVLFGLANRARLGLLGASGIAVDACFEYWTWQMLIGVFVFFGLYVIPFIHLAD
jgi:Cytochrome c oxidase subunit III